MSMTMKELMQDNRSAGGKYAPFEQIGDKISGRVLGVSCPQATDYRTKEPLFWEKDGKRILDRDGREQPKWMCVITVQTDLRDPDDPEDDGIRSVWVKWWGAQRMSMQQTLNETGSDEVLPGGWFSAEYVGTQPGEKGLSPTKLFTYEYKPPTAMSKLPGMGAPSRVTQQPYAPPTQREHVVELPEQPVLTYEQQTSPTPPPTVLAKQMSGLPVQQPQTVAAAAQSGAPDDLFTKFAQIKEALARGMQPHVVALMVPGVDLATIQAIAAAPVQ